jgi:hypothetical protein
MPATAWTVQIKPEIDAAYGTNTWPGVTYQPSNIQLIKRSQLQDTSTLAFTIPLSDPNLTRDQFGPWRSDVRLIGPDGNNAFQGIITKTQLSGQSQVLHVSAEDYSCYLKRRMYPFGYAHTSYTGTPFTPQSYGPPGNDKTSAAAIEALIGQMNFDTVAVVGSTLAAERTYSVTRHGSFVVNPDYTITPGDTTSIFDHISQIGQQDGSVGFDYHIDENKAIHVYSGYYQVAPSIYTTIMGTDIIDLQWANNGPANTYEIGFGYGHGLSGISADPATEQRFGYMVAASDYGDSYTTQGMIDNRAAARGRLNRYPQHDATLTMYLDNITPLAPSTAVFLHEYAGALLTLDASCFTAFTPFHTILAANVNYRATEIQMTISNEGDTVVQLTLEQAYITDATIG